MDESLPHNSPSDHVESHGSSIDFVSLDHPSPEDTYEHDHSKKDSQAPEGHIPELEAPNVPTSAQNTLDTRRLNNLTQPVEQELEDPAPLANRSPGQISQHQHGKFESFSRSRASTGPMFETGAMSDGPSNESDHSSPTSHRTHGSVSDRNNVPLISHRDEPDKHPEEGLDILTSSMAQSEHDQKDAVGAREDHSSADPFTTSSHKLDGNNTNDASQFSALDYGEPPSGDDEWSKVMGLDEHAEVVPQSHQDHQDRPSTNNSVGQTGTRFEAEMEGEDSWTKELSSEPFESSVPTDHSSSELPRRTVVEENTALQGSHFDAQKRPETQAIDDLSYGDAPGVGRQGDLEDTWEKALSGEPAIDEAWGAAFADHIDHDGFLEDEKPSQINRSAQPSYQPQSTSNHTAAYNKSLSSPQTSRLNSYHAPPPIQPQPPQAQHTTSGGMKFFEDLPLTQAIKPRRPKQQTLSSMPQPGPPPPNAAGLSRQPSGPAPPTQFGGLRAPERLDPFPPQPTIPPPTAPTGTYISPPQSTPSTNLRYSPAPAQPTPPASKYSAAPHHAGPQANQRYSPATAPQPELRGLTPSRSVYAPAPTLPTPSGASTPPQASYFPPQPVPAAALTTQAPSAAPAKPKSRYAASPSQSPLPPPKDKSPPKAPEIPPTAPLSQAFPEPPPPPPHALTGHRFAPRTSSPLAQHEEPEDIRIGLNRAQTVPSGNKLPEEEHGHTQRPSQTRPIHIPPAVPESPPVTQNLRSHSSIDLTRHASTDEQRPLPPPKLIEAPQRPRTQSPEASKRSYQPSPQSDRPSSSKTAPLMPAPFTASQHPNFVAVAPSTSDEMNFVEPSDPAQVTDPLQRWKGCPIIQWSSSGLVTSQFPLRAPRYGGGQAAPAIKSSPGEIKLRKTRDVMPPDESLTSFPGPLKSKGKKKDVLLWLSQRIATLQREQSTAQMITMDPRVSERIMLWQLMVVMVEHDGVLSGNPSVDTAIQNILALPAETRSATGDGGGISLDVKPDAINPPLVADIRQSLLNGDREKAIWSAVDNRMWGHAMLMSSTLNPSVWKQVLQEFVRKEIRAQGPDNQSLAALYSTFAGNWDECVDELVPLSARAGFQMMSTADAPEQNKSALDGLNKWQEALTLILKNRSNEDEKALTSLGRLLRGYGRIEAAHICFLFSRSSARFGGLDDPEADYSLLATNVTGPFARATHDLDALLLTEVYEFALSLHGQGSAQYIPHLQAYKLHHAHALAEHGCRYEALQYCEAISTVIKSSTRLSAYYHPILIGQLDELNKRLSDSPKDGASSWMSKPSIGKVSGSMWAKFNTFVTGEDDNASNGSATHSEGDAGPFAKYTGGTPTISRSPSHADLYGSSFGSASSVTPVTSRYAPSYTSHPSHPSHPSGLSENPYQPPTAVSTAPGDSQQLADPNHATQGIPIQNAMVGQPQPPAQPSYAGNTPLYGTPPMQLAGAAVPSGNDTAPKMNGYIPAPSMNGFTPGAQNFGIPPRSYEPPASSYQPSSSYQPYDPGDVPGPDSPLETRPKKSIMDDDDDDIAQRAADMKNRGSARTDREPDDAVRRAAEEDAARDKAAKEKKSGGGWLGSLFGGKKDANAPTVHKAKLGEESSFYFDEQTKKWVNKKALPSEQAARTAPAPPPPRVGPPSRAPSALGVSVPGAAPPPMGRSTSSYVGAPTAPTPVESGGLPLRNATPARSDVSSGGLEAQGEASPPTNLPTPGAISNPPSAPPSRPSTSMSNASSIDDLLGAPGARRGGTIGKKGKKGQRYVDPMAK